MKARKFFTMMLALTMLIAGTAFSAAFADEVQQPEGYPSGVVSWIAPVAAGAAVDLPTRACAELLDFGTVVVENIAGASQTLGTAEAASRAADGQTLLTMANACGISQPILNPELAYSLDDFRFLTMLTPSVQATICVKKGSELADIDKLLAYIKLDF